MTAESPVKKPTWFGVKEAADYLDVGEQTIYRWMREKKITYRKVGDSTRFLKEDLDATVRVYPSDEDSDVAKHICPFCHHDEMLPGAVRSTGKIWFTPKKTRFWTLKDSSIPMTAVMCTRCGAVLTFGDTEKLASLRTEEESKE